MTEPVALKYRAFISYSHADTTWAKWLHRGLESFRIDADLVGRETNSGTIPKTLKPIFRDRDDFTAGHTLTEQTLAALDASAALIALCSPAAAKSHYVNEEIRLFKSRHPKRPVIPLIVDGKPGDPERECFPPALKFKVDAKGRIGKKPLELLAADAREEGDGKPLALAKVIAGLLDVTSDEVFRRAERERRRKARVRNGVIGVLAFLSVAAIGSAAYAWQQLKTNEAFLYATLQTATGIVDDAVAQAERFGVPRSATLSLLTKAEGLFDNMAMLGKPTPELRYQKAWMLLQFANNYQAVGDTKKWRERALSAQEILTELADEEPDNVNYASELATANGRVGDVLMAQGDLPGALQSYIASLKLATRLASADWSNGGLLRGLAYAVERVGRVQLAQGKLADALKSFQSRLELATIIARANPTDANSQRDLSLSNNQIGDVMVAEGDSAGALSAYRQGLDIIDRLAKTDPNNAGWQRDLAYSYNMIGLVQSTQGHLDEALKSFRDSLAITDRLAKADPSNAGWQHDLANAYERVGDALARAGQSRGRLAVLSRGGRHSRPAGEGRPRQRWLAARSFRRQRARSATCLLQRATRPAPCRHIATGPISSNAWPRPIPAIPAGSAIGPICTSELAASSRRKAHPDEALKSYRDGLAIREGLAKSDPSNAGWQHDVAVAHDLVGDALAAQGNLADALQSYRDELAIYDRLTKSDTDNAGWQRDLSVATGKIGIMLLGARPCR